jgi:hypothetical protein
MTLWLPEYASELILVHLQPSASDSTGIEDMILLNQGANDWLNGDIDNEYYFDLLAENEIEPEQHLQPLLDRVEDFL